MKISINKKSSDEEDSKEINRIFPKGRVDRTADFISNKIALPIGIIAADLDILIRLNSTNTKGFTYFDALPIALMSIPVAKKVLDSSLNRFEESVYFKNKKMHKYATIGILSTGTYFIANACATYNAVLDKAISKPYSVISTSTAEFFVLGLASLGVGLATVGLSKRALFKKYRRD